MSWLLDAEEKRMMSVIQAILLLALVVTTWRIGAQLKRVADTLDRPKYQ